MFRFVAMILVAIGCLCVMAQESQANPFRRRANVQVNNFGGGGGQSISVNSRGRVRRADVQINNFGGSAVAVDQFGRAVVPFSFHGSSSFGFVPSGFVPLGFAPLGVHCR